MLKKDLSKPAPTKLKVVNKKKDNKTEAPRAIKLSIFTQFYPPDYAATGQLIEELAIELAKLGIDV